MPVELLTRHRLSNPHGWVLVYAVNEDPFVLPQVTLERYYKGERVRDTEMTLVEARLHYATQLRAGFVSQEKF